MAITNYQNGLSSFGIPLLGDGAGILPTGGSTFWVSSITGQNAVGKGLSPADPFRTIAYAITQCVANKGDTILVLPGHVENVTAAGTITMNIAGVSVIGLGQGSARPTIRFTTATAATITWSAANCRWRNIVIDMASGALDAVAVGVTVTGASASFENIYLYQADATYQGVVGFSLGAGANKAKFFNLDADATAAAGAASAILVAGAVNDVLIVNPRIRGNYSNAPIHGTANVIDLSVEGGQMWQQNGTAKAIYNLTAGSTGMVANQAWRGTTWTTVADSVANAVLVRFYNNIGFDDASGIVSGVLAPAVGTVA